MYASATQGGHNNKCLVVIYDYLCRDTNQMNLFFEKPFVWWHVSATLCFPGKIRWQIHATILLQHYNYALIVVVLPRPSRLNLARIIFCQQTVKILFVSFVRM